MFEKSYCFTSSITVDFQLLIKQYLTNTSKPGNTVNLSKGVPGLLVLPPGVELAYRWLKLKKDSMSHFP